MADLITDLIFGSGRRGRTAKASRRGRVKISLTKPRKRAVRKASRRVRKRGSSKKTIRIVLDYGKGKRKTITYKPYVRTVYVKVGKRTIGKSKTAIDKRVKALPPGKRRTKHGTVYYEYRKNRSDIDLKKQV